MKNGVELRARQHGGPEPLHIRRTIDRELLQPKLLRRNLRDSPRVIVSLLFEILGGKHPRREADRLGLLAAYPAAGKERHVLGAMRPDHPVPERTDVARASGDRRKTDARI